MNILKLAAMLTLDGTRFKAGLKEAEAASRSFANELGSSLKGELAAAFGAGALVAFAKDSLKMVAGLKDLAEQAHMTTDEVQQATAAAEHMGLSFQDVSQAERQFNQNRKQAAEGNEELRETFARYGVTLKDLQNPQFKFFDFLTRANDAMRGMNESEMTRGLNDLADILGNRVGPKLQEFIKQLHEVKSLPMVDPASIEKADKFWDKVGDVIRAAKAQTALSFMSPMNAPVPTLFRMLMGDTGPKLDGSALPLPKPGANAPLFEDKAAIKRREEFQKAARDLEATSMIFGLSKRASLESQLREGLDFIREAEDAAGGRTTASLGARKDSLGILGQLMGLKGDRPDVAALQRVGQLGGGRNFTSGDSELVKEAKSILGVLRESKQVQEAIRDKKGKTINI